ncbi:MAG: ATP-binding protein [Candidatus Methanomethylophilaceae archaeon]
MDIQQAKDSIRDAVTAYLSKDAAGNYVIPRGRQRPLMVMGAPGLGKTAIMSQIASEMGIGYVAYTITHHTRQSAIGLPVIEKRVYGGKECSMTRYTMSEIIASVHDAIESRGHREGILFIDEINCVSETLAPAMLDLLQNKKFGPHRIPEGWILVAAGNPPEYNSSARTFDIATQDRIRMIEVEPDTDVWIRYAVSSGMHDAVVFYLRMRPENLLRIERTVDGTSFVTPRGWEDLSTVMKEYDRMGISVDTDLISQYIRDPEISAEFSRYLDFHRRYREDYDVDSILSGNTSEPPSGDAEEKMALTSVIIGRLNSEAERGMDLGFAVSKLSDGTGDIGSEIADIMEDNADPDTRRACSLLLSMLKDRDRESVMKDAEEQLSAARRMFDTHLCNAVEYMRSGFGDGQETVSLLVGLIDCYNVVMFSDPDGPLYRYNDELLSSGRNRRIMDMLEGA